jgi:pilus assembly protein Flp/PilA
MQQKGWMQEAARYRARWVKLRRDVQAQDLIEYALMAGFVAVAAGALMPTVSSSISTVFSKISSVMTVAAAS